MASRGTKDFIDLAAHDGGHLRHLLALTGRLKSGELGGRPLEGRCLAMIFRKSSTRTRVSTEVGMAQLGGHALMISDRDSQMGRGESVRDTARVLSRYVDAILIRTFGHDEVVELAREASVPVINGLTDLLHPCQVMADLFTAVEEFGDANQLPQPTVFIINLALDELILDARGAWRLELRDGPQLRLGADSIDLRLQRALLALDELAGEPGSEIAYMDLRYPNGLAVAWRSLNTTAGTRGGRSP